MFCQRRPRILRETTSVPLVGTCDKTWIASNSLTKVIPDLSILPNLTHTMQLTKKSPNRSAPYGPPFFKENSGNPHVSPVHLRASTITSTQRAGHQESLRPNLCVSNDTFDGNITSPLAKCDSQWTQGEPFQHCYLWDHCVGKASPVLSFRHPWHLWRKNSATIDEESMTLKRYIKLIESHHVPAFFGGESLCRYISLKENNPCNGQWQSTPKHPVNQC